MGEAEVPRICASAGAALTDVHQFFGMLKIR